MHRSKQAAKAKSMIVVEGLKGKPAAELCNEHQINQTLTPARHGHTAATPA